VYWPWQGSVAYGEIRCSCIAASAVTGLNVEPGGYVAMVARLSAGKFVSDAVFGVRPAAASFFVVTRPA
jgi:hypothetical protein